MMCMAPWCLFAFAILLQTVENEGTPTWPYGMYTLPKPKTGCPDGWDGRGYLYQDTIDKNPSNNRSETLHIDGEVACSHVKRYFCSKIRFSGIPWPPGEYCVFRHENETLFDMKKGSIRMFGEKINNEDEYKFTKFHVLIKRNWFGSYAYTRLYFTCNIRGSKKIPISLPITKPFYLLPYGSRDCQQVEWMVATSEWIKYHTDNYKGRYVHQKRGEVPYHELRDISNKGITMFYCYYESCNYTLNDTNGAFQSPGFPGKYPDGQLCSWRIMVPDNHTLHVHFTNFSLGENDTLKYSRNINGSFRPWTPVFNTTFTWSADSDVLFEFRSDKSNNSFGFRAEYRVFIPQATEKPSAVPVTTLSKGKTTTKSRSSTMKMTSSQLTLQNDDSKAQAVKGSPVISGYKAILVVAIPAGCLLIGVVLFLIMISYQCRARKRRRAWNSQRDSEGADRSVMNPTYERDAILLNPRNETAMAANTALHRDAGSGLHQEYDEVECKKLTKETPGENTINSGTNISEPNQDNGPKISSQSDSRDSEAVQDSGPNPLYHGLEGPHPNNEAPADDRSYENIDRSELAFLNI